MFVIIGLLVLLLGLGSIQMSLGTTGSIIPMLLGVIIALMGTGLIIHPFYNLSWVITFLGKY